MSLNGLTLRTHRRPARLLSANSQPIPRYGQAEDTAALVAYVAGPHARSINGTVPDHRRRRQQVTKSSVAHAHERRLRS